MAEFQRRGSNRRFSRVINLELQLVDYRLLGSGSWIPLPGKLAAKKAVVNPKNKDDQCFKWCLAIAFEPEMKNPQRISERVAANSKLYNCEGIEFPVKLREITKFERKNPGIAVNVFGFEKVFYPLRISKVEGIPVDLLLISNGEKQHFCWIRNLSKLLSSHVISHKNGKVFCRRCLNHFPSQKKLNKHSELCGKKNFVKIEMDSGTVKFENFKRKEKVPFVVYSDLEAINQKVNSLKGRTSTKNIVLAGSASK